MVAAAEPLAGLGEFALRDSHRKPRSEWARALARPGVKIRPAPGTEPGAILAAEGIRGHGQREFLAHRRADVHVGYLRRKRVYGGVVRRIRISAEEHLDIRVERRNHVRKAPAAGAPEPSRYSSLPVELVVTRLRETAVHPHRPVQIQTEPGERCVTRIQLADGHYRSALKIPDINLKHSPKS